ncbi:UNVERIFIED_CONTAM: hypothetical protein K2H54_036369 [Gekko kuhli]
MLDALFSHFQEFGHAVDDFQFSLLYVSGKTNVNAIRLDLLCQEYFWIFQLNTLQPNGHNATNEVSCFLLGPIDLDPSSFTTQELKKALAKMKESTKADDTLEQKAHQEDVRRRFRPIEKLKEEFRELNMQLETDFEIMSKLINRFNSTTSTLEEKIAALYDLEYYVHQVDNAKDLLSLGGLQLLINGLNSTEPLLKEYASFVLGAALSRRGMDSGRNAAWPAGRQSLLSEEVSPEVTRPVLWLLGNLTGLLVSLGTGLSGSLGAAVWLQEQ